MAASFSSRIELEQDSIEAWYEYAEREDIGDGLPLIPPTPERVEAMIAASGRKADDLVCILPPKRGAATIEKIAINAVMAGCRPEFMPAVIAAVDATGDPTFDIYTVNTTTNSATPFLVINGPDRDTLGVNYQESCFGSAGRANATIGRALRLVQINVGGAISGKVSKSVFGQPGRYTMCIGEWEERNPWEPLHVQRGYRRDQNTITAFTATGTLNVTTNWSMSGEDYLHMVARSMDMVGGAWHMTGEAEHVVVINPTWAGRIAQDGFSLRDVQQYLWENSKVSLDRFPKDHHEPLRQDNHILAGNVVPIRNSPDKIWIIVAGGSGSLQTLVVPGFVWESSVTRPFELVKQTSSG